MTKRLLRSSKEQQAWLLTATPTLTLAELRLIARFLGFFEVYRVGSFANGIMAVTNCGEIL